MNFLDKVWEYVAYTKIGKLIASLILAFSSFALANVLDSMFYVGLVFMIYPIGLFCVMMAYAWVINPIRDWKETKKMKEEYKIKNSLKQIVEPVATAAPVVIEPAAEKVTAINPVSPGVYINEIKATPEVKKAVTKKPVAKKIVAKKTVAKKTTNKKKK
jgi:hypothetical protein